MGLLMTPSSPIAAIAIGRNEGARLTACLTSLRAAGLSPIVYVDSGSTDGSVEEAKRLGAQVVQLDMSQPFTAARARNAGKAALQAVQPDFVQFIDADCRLAAEWLPEAETFLRTNAEVAVVCGRRREIDPEASVYNQLCDAEWNTPVGPAAACGGDALMRWGALEAVGGYNPLLIAGEEPEMCYRMRQLGWKIHRLDVEMTLHDAAMTQFSQFWNRARRAGFAYAEGAAMYGRTAERYNVVPVLRALVWAVLIPIVIALLTGVFGAIGFAAVLIYPIQVLRLAARLGWHRAMFLTVGKFAEAHGILEYGWRRIQGGKIQLIEYK